MRLRVCYSLVLLGGVFSAISKPSRTTHKFTAAIAGIAIAYTAWIVFHRLYLHPLARFPGPKVVAMCRWYEAYHEIVKKGTFYVKIDEFHDKYAPNELHIRDSTFYDRLYTSNLQAARSGWENRFGNPGAMIATRHHVLHQQRRAALRSLFSRRSILAFEDIISKHTQHLIRRVEGFRRESQVLNIGNAFCALTGDIIMDYAFGFNYQHVGDPEFASFREALVTSGDMGHIGTFFPAFFSFMFSLPAPVINRLQSKTGSLLLFQRSLSDLLDQIVRGEQPKHQEQNVGRTIFQEILESDLPAKQKTKQRLTDEAFGLVGAGVTTVAFTLTLGTFYIINDRRVYRRLKQDLEWALPDRQAAPKLLDLEQIPYLRACIQEAVRLSHGITARNPRVHDKPLQYSKWSIPAFTAVSMSSRHVHLDEELFP